MDERDKRRIRKAEMLKEFSSVRKKHWITVCLAVFLGHFGAQRIYLKQYKIAVCIFSVFALTLALTVINILPELLLGLTAVSFIIFLFEIFYGTKATDKVNDKIRAKLEDDFKLNMWD